MKQDSPILQTAIFAITNLTVMLKNKFRIAPLSIVLSLLLACQEQNAKHSSVDKRNSTSKKHSIVIDTFSTFPPEIDGCSCYFASDSINFEQESFIYMNDYENTSFIKINGILTKFIHTSRKNIDSNTITIKGKSQNYDMTIEIKDGIQHWDETWFKSGTIKLTDKTGKTTTQSFFGECGC